MYLLRRGALFHFSRKIPDPFRGETLPLASGPRKVGSNGYLRFSLGTGNRREAERLARRYAVEVDEALQAVAPLASVSLVDREEAETPEFQVEAVQDWFESLPPEEQARMAPYTRIVPRPTFTAEEIQRAAQLFYASVLQEDETQYRELVASLLAPGSRGDDSEDRLLIHRENPYFVGELPPPGVVGDVALLKALKVNIAHFLHLATGRNAFFWRLEEGYEPFAAAFRAAARDLKSRQAGEDIPSPPLPEPPATDPHRPLSWEDLLDYWRNDCERHPRTAQEMQTLIRSLAAFLPGKTPATMAKQDVTAWLRHERDIRGNGAKTLEKKGTLMGALFSIAVKDDLLPSNPFSGFDYKRFAHKIGIDDGEARKPFQKAQLERLFSFEGLFSQTRKVGGGGYHARIWLPLLGLFTGARLNELAQLRTADIQRDPVPYFRIRRAKNAESLREVPLHPKLVELGFLDYVDALQMTKQERLWPELQSRGVLKTEGEVFSKWFNRYLHQVLGYPSTVVFHSFRHTFKDLCRNAGIARDLHHQLTGHASGAVGDAYGAGYSLEVLHAAVARIEISFFIPKPKCYSGNPKVKPGP